jgi:hypothetical protein
MKQIAFHGAAVPEAVSIVIPVYKDVVGLDDTIKSVPSSDRVVGSLVKILVANDAVIPAYGYALRGDDTEYIRPPQPLAIGVLTGMHQARLDLSRYQLLPNLSAN